MPRYAIRVAYDGGAYHGWQKQSKLPTVQGEVERVLSTVMREPIEIYAAGRTDTGVHAHGQVAHFDSTHCVIDVDRILLGSRALLPRDIVITQIDAVHDAFHARFDAKWRQYQYRMRSDLSPFERGTMWVVHPWPNTQILDECALMLIGQHDFTSFCKQDSALESNLCTIFHSKWTWETDTQGYYTIQANRFLHHMVRGLVGTMVRAARQGSTDYFQQVLDSKTRSEAVLTAPANGLFLESVGYQ